MFEELKTRVTMEPVLAHPVLTDPFELEVDASGFAMGAVLLQKKEDGKKHPIAYYSKTLSVVERNYNVYDLKLLAIVNAMDHWRPYLAGSPHKIIIYSDHQNLLYWKEPHKISRCIAREVLMLLEYNFEICHIKGTANRQADALSRHPDYDQGQNDNQNVTVLPEQVFVRAIEILNDYMKQDENTLKAWVDPHQLKMHQGIWYKDRRRVITGDVEAKHHLIQSHHDPPAYGHPGISKTIQLTERLYWWPQMQADIMEYVKGCADCQCHKVNTRPTKAPLQPIYPKAEALPFKTIALDFIVKLCYGWSAIVLDVSEWGLILNVNNEYRRSALMTEGVQQSKDEYHKGIVGGAVQAQSMTTVIEGKAVFTHRDRRWRLSRCSMSRCDRRGNSKYYKERTK
jgi:hypothetical protein